MHKEQQRRSVQILDNYFGINALYIKLLIELVNNNIVTTFPLLCFNNPPSSSFLRVTLGQSSKLK